MRADVYNHIRNKSDLLLFIRENPIWYRKLMRNPKDFKTLELAAMNYYEKTIPHKIEKFSNSLQLASMMMNLFYGMKQED